MDINNILDYGIDYLRTNSNKKTELWKDLLNILRQDQGLKDNEIQQSQEYLNHLNLNIDWSLISKSTSGQDIFFNGNNGLYKEYTDFLKEQFKKSIERLDLDNGEELNWNDNFWNESVQKLIRLVATKLDPEIIAAYENSGILVEKEDGSIDTKYLRGTIHPSAADTVDMRVKDIKEADAGNSFVKESEMYETIYLDKEKTKSLNKVVNPWVVSWYNIDGHSYKKVRGKDRINGVLSNSKNLDFTREQGGDLDKWIRLIMPRNKRRVEIEDLDRNFWVITQALAAISIYLFDENSPIRQSLKDMLKELGQLWENILYLWAYIALKSQPPAYDKVHIEVIPVSNNKDQSFYTHLKYDNVYNGAASSLFNENEQLSYLKNLYSEHNLIIFPLIRTGNYEQGHYYKEEIPYSIIYNRNTDTVTTQTISGLVFNMKDSFWRNNLSCYKEYEKTGRYILYYKTTYALENGVPHSEDGAKMYYGLKTTIENVNYTLSNYDSLVLNSFDINFTDIGLEMMGQVEMGDKKPLFYSHPLNKNTSDNSFSFNRNAITFPALDEKEEKDGKIQRGIYLNEVCSYYLIAPTINYTIKKENYGCYPININRFVDLNNNLIDTINWQSDSQRVLVNRWTSNDITEILVPKDKNFLHNVANKITDNSFHLLTTSHNEITLSDIEDASPPSVNYYSYDTLFPNFPEKINLNQKKVGGVVSDVKWTTSSGTKRYVSGTKAGSRVNTAALLINKLLKTNIAYNKYPHEYDWGIIEYKNDDSTWTNITEYNTTESGKKVYYETSPKDGFFIYVKKGDKRITKDNWCIELIEAKGIRLDKDLIKSLDPNKKLWYQTTGDTQHCVAIEQVWVTLFYPDGTMKQKKKTRGMKEKDVFIINSNFSVENTSGWYDLDYDIENDNDWDIPLDVPDPKTTENFNLHPINGITL